MRRRHRPIDSPDPAQKPDPAAGALGERQPRTGHMARRRTNASDGSAALGAERVGRADGRAATRAGPRPAARSARARLARRAPDRWRIAAPRPPKRQLASGPATGDERDRGRGSVGRVVLGGSGYRRRSSQPVVLVGRRRGVAVVRLPGPDRCRPRWQAAGLPAGRRQGSSRIGRVAPTGPAGGSSSGAVWSRPESSAPRKPDPGAGSYLPASASRGIRTGRCRGGMAATPIGRQTRRGCRRWRIVVTITPRTTQTAGCPRAPAATDPSHAGDID